MSGPKVDVQVTEYDVSILPRDCLDRRVWGLKVAYRGNNRWAVLRGVVCLSRDGDWDYEHIPSERRDEWLATHRFDEHTARELAIEHAPNVMVNGMTATEVFARHQARQATP